MRLLPVRTLIDFKIPTAGSKSFLVLMNPSITLLPLLLMFCLTGCVVFPHGEWIAPPALGQVMDADDLRPIAQATVTRYIETFERNQVVRTGAQGIFELKKDTDLRWLPFMCYSANLIDYRIEAEGYCTFTTNLYGGGSFSHGRQPHYLSQVLLQRLEE